MPPRALTTDDTIAAIASATGGAMRGIIRVSGPAVRHCLEQACVAPAAPTWQTVTQPSVVAAAIVLPAPFASLPCDVYFWPTERSYTRQPSAEIHTIGSPPLLDVALRTLCAAGARLAQPGEFTLRAFLAGRLDLTQAEAVLGVIDAGSRKELDIALRQLAGGLTGPLTELRNRLLDLLAHLEAGLDFVEEDIEFITPAELDAQLAASEQLVASLQRRMTTRNESQGDVRVALVGLPNVGKSSLLNALAGDAAAIVADVPGTTRDYLALRIAMNNVPCLLIDTAGIESVTHEHSVEHHAQTLTRAQHEQAHLQLLCLDASRPLTDWERSQVAASASVPRLVVATKTDFRIVAELPPGAILTSSVTGAGLDNLRAAIAQQITASAAHDTIVVAGTAARCRESLHNARESLARARDAAQHAAGEELVAAELRVALDELAQIVGAVYTDDVLDRIFSRFCIGK